MCPVEPNQRLATDLRENFLYGRIAIGRHVRQWPYPDDEKTIVSPLSWCTAQRARSTLQCDAGASRKF